MSGLCAYRALLTALCSARSYDDWFSRTRVRIQLGTCLCDVLLPFCNRRQHWYAEKPCLHDSSAAGTMVHPRKQNTGYVAAAVLAQLWHLPGSTQLQASLPVMPADSGRRSLSHADGTPVEANFKAVPPGSKQGVRDL